MSQTDREDLTERVNRAYWETDAGVNHIAEALDVSKSALYGMVEALETGTPCPVCGGPLAWENRTARDKDDAVCLACAEEGEAGASEQRSTRPAATEATRDAPRAEAAGPAVGGPANGAAIPVDQARALGGAVLLGLGAGFLAAAMLIRRR